MNARTAERTQSLRDEGEMDKGRWDGGGGMKSAASGQNEQ